VSKINLINTRLSFDKNKNYEELGDSKGVIRIRKSMNREHNGQKKKDKWTGYLKTFLLDMLDMQFDLHNNLAFRQILNPITKVIVNVNNLDTHVL